jgi:hypothetical protein
MTSCDIRQATHVKHKGEWHRIASKWGIDAEDHLAKPSGGGFGCVTDTGLRIGMMEAEAYRDARAEGIREIEGASWGKDDPTTLDLRVHDMKGRVVHAWLTMRQPYCDRGHLQLNIEMPSQSGPPGLPELDDADGFPRYFFSFEEADAHTRAFLRWRLWKERTHSPTALRAAFGDWTGSRHSDWSGDECQDAGNLK